jgi:hypothetical protein
MFISRKEMKRLVKQGETAQINYWVYDIVAGHLEEMGFKRRSGIGCEGPVKLDGSIYCNEAGDRVVVATHRFAPYTVVSASRENRQEETPQDIP